MSLTKQKGNTMNIVTQVAKQAKCSPEEAQLRVELAAAYRLTAKFGMDDLIYTHLSARVPGPDLHFLLNPYGAHTGVTTVGTGTGFAFLGNAGITAARVNACIQ